MDRDPNRIRGLIKIESKLRRFDRTLERPGSGAKGDLVTFIGSKSKGLFSVDTPILFADVFSSAGLPRSPCYGGNS